MKKLGVVLTTLIACAHAEVSPPKPAPLPPGRHAELVAEIEALAARTLAETPVVGFSIAVVSHGDAVLAKGYGLADLDAKTPVDAQSIFRIGSVTKQFTAAAILQLAHAGKLRIDDELIKYLPDYPTQGKKITLRHLLTHTSGIKNYTALPWFDEHQNDAFPRAELVAKFAAEPLDFDPGTKWSYSNSGYYLLGLVIEKVSGQSYADYVRDHVVAPAGLAATGYCPPTQDYPHAAKGYRVDGDKQLPAMPLVMAHPFAAGSLCSTASDLVAWSAALAHGKVIDEASWREMTTPVKLTDGTTPPYGFGIGIGELDGHRKIAHGGGINGFVSTLAYFPDDDLYVAVLVDTESGLADRLGDKIARLALGIPEPVVKDEPVPAEVAKPLVGSYTFADVGITLVVSYEGGQLIARKDEKDPGVRLRAQGDGTYVVVEGNAKVTFEVSGERATSITIEQNGHKLIGQRAP